MSLPLVVSASKVHMIRMKNVRKTYMPHAYKPHFVNASVENPKTTKAYLHNQKNARKAVKCIAKRKSTRLKNSSVQILSEYGDEPSLNSISKERKNKRNKVLRNSPNKVENSSNTTTNRELNSPSVVLCAVRKTVCSHATKHCLPKRKLTCTNSNTTTTLLRRPKTSTSKKTSSREAAQLHIKRQSCPPPLMQKPQTPIHNEVIKIRKVYCSEAQSRTIAGVPCVPPTTPLSGLTVEILVYSKEKHLSQQTIKAKLRNLEIQREKANAKLREKCLKEEKRQEKEQRESLRQQRRAEIYALNKVMADHERGRFLQFMKEKGSRSPTISLKV